jgi:hypothetical protein
MTIGGWNLKPSIYANKFKGRNCVVSFYNWVMKPEQKALREKAKKEMKGKVLGCWCAGKGKQTSCHGEVWIYIVDGYKTKSLEQVLKDEKDLFDEVSESKKWFDETYLDPEGEFYINPGSAFDRVRGMFMGLFMGDSMGALHEFEKGEQKLDKRIKEGLRHYNRYQKTYTTYGRGQVTDDSEMAITLANHMAQQYEIKLAEEGKVVPKIESSKLTLDYMAWGASGQNFMGKNTRFLFVGVKTLKGFESHYEKKFGFPCSFNTYNTETSDVAKNTLSNGSLMRCCSLALFPDGTEDFRDMDLTNPSDVVQDIEGDYLIAIRKALRGRSASHILEFLLRKNKDRSDEFQDVIEDLETGHRRTLKNLKRKGVLLEGKGSVMSSIYATLVCLMWYVDGVKPYKNESKITKPTILDMYQCLVEDFPESDSDTNCAIMGALMGAIMGYSKMEKEEKDFEYNASIVMDITEETEKPRHLIYHPSYMYTILPTLFDMYNYYNEVEDLTSYKKKVKSPTRIRIKPKTPKK